MADDWDDIKNAPEDEDEELGEDAAASGKFDPSWTGLCRIS